jgi:NhaP-type Na+/H+ or K+/H+ antiporter
MTQLFLLPLSLILGVLTGFITGFLIVFIFKHIHIRDTLKVLILFGLSFFMIVLEDVLPISGLLAIITLGITIFSFYPILAKRLTSKFTKIWVIAEIMLFVLIGAAVDITLFKSIGLLSIILVFAGLIFRLIGVILSITKTHFNFKEKSFICIAYTPKATVQAAIGAIPLSMGIPGGELILAISVLSIFLTAPIGAILIDQTAKKLLSSN